MSTRPAPAGELLRHWRGNRRLSQLELASLAGVSQRHLSFLETGRSNPSREMIIHLATILDVPLRERNAWLHAAGFAPMYSERPLDDESMTQIHHVLEVLLTAHEPFPAYVVDRHWNITMANLPAAVLTAQLVTDPTPLGGNVMRLVFHPDGLRRHVVNWEDAAAALLDRFRREVASHPGDMILAELWEEVLGYPGTDTLPGRREAPTADDLAVPLHLETPAGSLRLLTTIATIGAPYDVTVEELRLETLLPADRETEALLRGLG